MDFAGSLTMLFALIYVGVMVYLANQVEMARVAPQGADAGLPPALRAAPQAVTLRWMWYGLIAVMFLLGVLVLQASLVGSLSAVVDSAPPLVEIDLLAAGVTFALAAAASVFGYWAVAAPAARQWLRAHLPPSSTYDPESLVHTTALLLLLAVAVAVIATFVLQGGLSGYAEALRDAAVRPLDLVFQAVLQVVIALLGVGLALRRDLSAVLDRLALRLPTGADLAWGGAVGILFIGAMFVFSALWAALTTPEAFAEQTRAVSQLNAAFATLPLAFIVAISAAVGEEIWIRGALQPVFGIGLTSAFFAVLHTQVAFTPATLLIFGISLGLGWLRQRHSTSAAIVAHFVYNFVPLALLSVSASFF